MILNCYAIAFILLRKLILLAKKRHKLKFMSFFINIINSSNNPTIIADNELTKNQPIIPLNAISDISFLLFGQNIDIPDIHIPILDIFANPANDIAIIIPVL